MLGYIARRLLLIIPTLLGIMVINFAVIQFAPGGPVEQAIAEAQGDAVSATDIINRTSADNVGPGAQANENDSDITSRYRGAQGLDPDFVAQLEKQYGFDKPPLQRFGIMMANYLRFDFGESFFKSERVVDLIVERLPVSISLGLWSTLIAYLVSIPLGIAKAVRNGSQFDTFSSTLLIIGNAIPGFLFAILLVILFAGGSFFDVFPSRGLYSDNFDELSFWGKVADYFWHMTLPIIAMTISSFTILTLFTKNAFIDEISKQYVLTARAKGLEEKRVLYGHVFRNAMLIIIAGFPSLLFSTLLTGSVLIETVFSLDGLGLLGLEAVLDRDFPIIFGTLFVFSLLGLLLGLITDLTYMWVDPRIDFEARQA